MANYLTQKVIELSESKHWEQAVTEWYVAGCEEDESVSSTCVCGQEGLRYLFTIRNRLNDNELFPIGSHCIHMFGREDMDDDVDCMRRVWRIIDRAKEYGHGGTVSFDADKSLFSRKLIIWLNDSQHVFGAPWWRTEWGDVYRNSDCQFMLDMFNKRGEMTQRQHYKHLKIIRSDIYPYLRNVYRKARR